MGGKGTGMAVGMYCPSRRTNWYELMLVRSMNHSFTHMFAGHGLDTIVQYPLFKIGLQYHALKIRFQYPPFKFRFQYPMFKSRFNST